MKRVIAMFLLLASVCSAQVIDGRHRKIFSGGGGGSITHVNGTGGFTNSGSTAGPLTATAFNVTSGNAIVCAVRTGQSGATTLTLSDTAGNTFTNVTTSTQSGDFVDIYYAKNVTGNASDVIQVAFSINVAFPAIVCDQFSGLNTTSPLDTSATGNNPSVTTLATGAFTTTAANEVVFAAGAIGQLSQTFTQDTGYTLSQQQNLLASEYKIVSSIQTGVTVAMTFSGPAADVEIAAATFKQ